MKDIIDPFHRALRSVIYEKLEARTEDLITVTSVDYADYCGKVSYIRALRDLLSFAEDVEVQIYGGKKNSLEDKQDLY